MADQPRPRRGRRVRRVLLILLAAFAVFFVLTVRNAATKQAKQPEFPAVAGRPAQPAPALPADRVLFDSDREGHFEIYVADLDGGATKQLTDDARFDSWWPRISPDRTRILFYRSPKGLHDKDYAATSLWMMGADGSDMVLLRRPGTDGWKLQGHGEWSPDGTQLVMFGGTPTRSDLYVTSAVGLDARKVDTGLKFAIDPSWSPDGVSIAFVGCAQEGCAPKGLDVYVVPAKGGTPERLNNDDLRDHDPYFSHGGEHIAWLTQTATKGSPIGIWNLRIAAPDGSGLRRLTNDQAVNSKPEWAPGDETIWFHRITLPVVRGFQVFSIRPDGSGMKQMIPAPGTDTNEFPSLCAAGPCPRDDA